MFSAFISRNQAKAGAGVLAVGQTIKLHTRNDGNGGLVLVLGRIMRDGKYASKKNPIAVTLDLTTKEGTTSETLSVTDADGVHLGAADKAAVEALISTLTRVVVKEIK